MDNTRENQIVPGIFLKSSGEARVDPSMTDALFDLAIELEESTVYPVDVEHVLAAVVLAARGGELDTSARLSSDDPVLLGVLKRHVKTVFEQFDGNVGRDD
jgi:hypothetical protein